MMVKAVYRKEKTKRPDLFSTIGYGRAPVEGNEWFEMSPNEAAVGVAQVCRELKLDYKLNEWAL